MVLTLADQPITLLLALRFIGLKLLKPSLSLHTFESPSCSGSFSCPFISVLDLSSADKGHSWERGGGSFPPLSGWEVWTPGDLGGFTPACFIPPNSSLGIRTSFEGGKVGVGGAKHTSRDKSSSTRTLCTCACMGTQEEETETGLKPRKTSWGCIQEHDSLYH